MAQSIPAAHYFAVHVGTPSGDNIDNDKTDALMQIAGALDGESAADLGAILVAGADQLDGGDQRWPTACGKNTYLEVVGENGGYGERGRRWRPHLRRKSRRRAAVGRGGMSLPLKRAHVDLDTGAGVRLFFGEVAFGQTAVQIVGQSTAQAA